MTDNPTPFVVLACVVVGVLYYKGLIRLPRFGGRSNAAPQIRSSAQPFNATPTSESLACYPSDVLGMAFALSKRREAEAHVANQIALAAGKQIHDAFTAPFSPAGPAPDNGTGAP